MPLYFGNPRELTYGAGYKISESRRGGSTVTPFDRNIASILLTSELPTVCTLTTLCADGDIDIASEIDFSHSEK